MVKSGRQTNLFSANNSLVFALLFSVIGYKMKDMRMEMVGGTVTNSFRVNGTVQG